MARVSANAERTFVRLWTNCDDHGRCLDKPKLLKAALYPMHDDVTPETVDADLTELERADLIVRYVDDGKHVLAVRSWTEYQHPNRPSPSKYAEPPTDSVSTHGVLTEPSLRPQCRSGVEGSGYGEGEGEARDALALALQHWKPNHRITDEEVRNTVKTIRSRGYSDDAIGQALERSAYPSELLRALPATGAPPRPSPADDDDDISTYSVPRCRVHDRPLGLNERGESECFICRAEADDEVTG
jgi:hypothetical protein